MSNAAAFPVLAATYTIAVEGNIAVGKSTLCKKIIALSRKCWPAAALDVCLIEQPVHSMLSLFYSDPARYAMAFQIYMTLMRRLQGAMALHMRADIEIGQEFAGIADRLRASHGVHASQILNMSGEEIRDIVDTASKEIDAASMATHAGNGDLIGLTWWDRSAIGDSIFCTANLLLGRLSPEEFSVYVEIAANKTFPRNFAMVDTLKAIADSARVDAVLFLWDWPDSCAFRMRNVRQTQAEASVQTDYLLDIANLHWYVLVEILASRHLECPVILLSPDIYMKKPEQVRSIVSNVVANRRQGGSCSGVRGRVVFDRVASFSLPASGASPLACAGVETSHDPTSDPKCNAVPCHDASKFLIVQSETALNDVYLNLAASDFDNMVPWDVFVIPASLAYESGDNRAAHLLPDFRPMRLKVQRVIVLLTERGCNRIICADDLHVDA